MSEKAKKFMQMLVEMQNAAEYPHRYADLFAEIWGIKIAFYYAELYKAKNKNMLLFYASLDDADKDIFFEYMDKKYYPRKAKK